MLILILEIFYDFACEEGQDLSLYLLGYQWFRRCNYFYAGHFYPWEHEKKKLN